MRIAIVGQKDFGKAAMEAFVKRGHIVAGVFCAPDKPGEAPDPLRLGAEQLSIPVYALPSFRVEEARQALQALNVDLAVLAYVLQFVPQDFATIPTPWDDSIPSLLAAALSRTELDQLAHHPGRHAHGPQYFSACGRAR